MLKFEVFPVDIVDIGDKYIAVLDVPGVFPESLEIFGDDHSITVKGVKEGINAGKFIVMERFCGKFSRKITFPEAINIAKVKVKLKNGSLYFEIPKISDEIFIDTSVKIRIKI